MEFQIKGKCISNPEARLLRENGHKWCGKCKRALPYSEFDKNSKASDGHNGRCKSCVAEWRLENSSKLKEKSKIRYELNKENVLATVAKYRANNQDKIKKLRVDYYANKKDEILEKNDKYRKDNLEKVYSRQHEYHQENKEHRSKKNSEWRKNNRVILNNKATYKYNNDLDFRLRAICRGFVRRMYMSIGTRKQMYTKDALGYSPIELKEHIERLFKPGMSWDNYGKWHVDHVKPISLAKNIEEGIELSQLKNLQPLWAEENLIKHNKYQPMETV